MSKSSRQILDKLSQLERKTEEMEKAVKLQSDEIKSLKKQIAFSTTVSIEDGGKESTESYGNLILDEIVSLKKKLEGFSAESLRALVNDVAAMKNNAVDGASDFSLSELKDELFKLADLLSV